MQQEQLLLSEWLDSLMFERWGGKALTMKLQGSVYQCATNGFALVLAAGAGGIAAPSEKVSLVKNLLELDKGSGRQAFTLPLTALRAWLPADPDRVPCATCKGGELKEFVCKTCRGEGIEECYACGTEHECRECGGAKKSLLCKECEGDGTVDAPVSAAPIVPGAGAVAINRRVLQRFLGPLLRGDEVKVTYGDALDAVFFHGWGWTVIVMPIHYDGPKHGPLGQPLREARAA